MPAVEHPFPDDIMMLHQFDSLLTPAIGGEFTLNGASSLVSAGAWDGNALNFGGAIPGGGGAGSLYSAQSLAAYDWVVPALTIEFRVKMGGAQPTGNLMRILNQSLFNELMIGGSVDRYTIGIKNGSSITQQDLSIPARAGLWDHLAVVKIGNVVTFYVNGVTAGGYTSTTPPAAGLKSIALGSSSTTPDGQIDELCITRRALWSANFTPPAGPYSVGGPVFWPSSCRAWPAGMA